MPQWAARNYFATVSSHRFCEFGDPFGEFKIGEWLADGVLSDPSVGVTFAWSVFFWGFHTFSFKYLVMAVNCRWMRFKSTSGRSEFSCIVVLPFILKFCVCFK